MFNFSRILQYCVSIKPIIRHGFLKKIIAFVRTSAWFFQLIRVEVRKWEIKEKEQ